MPGNLAVNAMRGLAERETLETFGATEEGRQLVEHFLRQLDEPGGLLKVADQLLNLAKEDRAYLNDIPPRLQEAMRVVVRDVIASGGELDLQFWPAYDFELRMVEYGDTVLINLRGPYGQPYGRDSYVESTGTTRKEREEIASARKGSKPARKAQKRRGARKGR